MPISTDGLLVYLNYKSGLANGNVGTVWNNLAPSDTTGQYNATIQEAVTVQADGVRFATGKVTLPSPPINTYVYDGVNEENPTFEFWIAREPATGGSWFNIDGSGNPSVIEAYSTFDDRLPRVYVRNGAKGLGVLNGFATTETLIHFVIRKNPASADFEIFVNGIAKGLLNDLFEVDINGTISLGHNTSRGYFKGRINVFRMYNRQLTNQEIANHYANGETIGIATNVIGNATLPGTSSLTATSVVSKKIVGLSSLTASGGVVRGASSSLSSSGSITGKLRKNIPLIENGLKLYYHYKQGATVTKWSNIAKTTQGKYNLDFFGTPPTIQSDGIQFGGVDTYAQYVDETTANKLQVVNGWTAEAWFTMEDKSDGREVFFASDFRSFSPFALEVSATEELRFNVKGTVSTGNWLANFYSGGLHHVLQRYDPVADTLEYFSNGVKVFTKTAVGSYSSLGPFDRFNVSGGTYGEHWKGKISVIRYYDRALTDQEIQTSYEMNDDVGIPEITIKEVPAFEMSAALSISAVGQGGTVINVVRGQANLNARASATINATKSSIGNASLLGKALISTAARRVIAGNSALTGRGLFAVNVFGANIGKASLSGKCTLTVNSRIVKTTSVALAGKARMSISIGLLLAQANLTGKSTLTVTIRKITQGRVSIRASSMLLLGAPKAIISTIYLNGNLELIKLLEGKKELVVKLKGVI